MVRKIQVAILMLFLLIGCAATQVQPEQIFCGKIINNTGYHVEIRIWRVLEDGKEKDVWAGQMKAFGEVKLCLPAYRPYKIVGIAYDGAEQVSVAKGGFIPVLDGFILTYNLANSGA